MRPKDKFLMLVMTESIVKDIQSNKAIAEIVLATAMDVEETLIEQYLRDNVDGIEMLEHEVLAKMCNEFVSWQYSGVEDDAPDWLK